MDIHAERCRVMLNEIFRVRPKPGATMKRVAVIMGIQYDRRYKWVNGTNGMPDKYLPSLFQATQDLRVYDMLLPDYLSVVDRRQYQNGSFDGDTRRLLADTIKELSDVPVSLGNATADGKIDEEEDADIRKQIREAREMLAAIEVMLGQKTRRQQLHLLEVA